MIDDSLNDIADLLDVEAEKIGQLLDDEVLEDLPDDPVENSKVLTLRKKSGESGEACTARCALQSSITGAATIIRFTTELGDLSLNCLVDELNKQTDGIQADDMVEAQEMLAVQAITLNAIFQKLASQSTIGIGNNVRLTESYLKLALKAQSQSRATLETLSAIKNPPIQHIKQLNVAENQQVNNSVTENNKQQTKLSEMPNELCTHTGTQSLEKKADSTLEAVGEVHRAEVKGRKG